MRLHLKAGEKVFINGAVLSFEQKTSVKLLNDASFLLEAYVMQLEETTTPLRQLYFYIQNALIDPKTELDSLQRALLMLASIRKAVENTDILDGLELVEVKINKRRYFDALRTLKKLFDVELSIWSEDNEMDQTEAVIAPFARAVGEN
ncbi:MULTISPECIES: flagellar biosynthesis repressor FlbT [unclassified Pseudovibrio]|uniref:flagellar biosynthesis repressor FlbT n=1 Tax=unclassified Pseudovibrio TaxID=2627060 RepID=UPI0007AED689|nr:MULTISPECIES: flagellar biosynthesis repressor FlbT [unclassified Pseudovibrio]KZL24874.1 flagellum biosynthesis repressor protein FlbT [Pseudovibrio sp. Ad37]KZL28281.1 flagellum biosynthesis repressor protein FlbT [Pseudovibrio sp. WM33]